LKPAAPNVTDGGVGLQRLQFVGQVRTHIRTALHQTVVLQVVQHAAGHRRCHRVAAVSVSGAENAGVFGDNIKYFILHHGGAHRKIAGAQTFGQSDDVRHHIMMLVAESLARAADAAHDFIENHQHIVFVADFANSCKMLIRRVGRGQ